MSLSPFEASTLVVAINTENWRQYVPLVVSGLVIVDIALGSPAANAVLGKARGPTEGASGTDADGDAPIRNAKERIDTQKVAQAALDRASSTLELRRFLEENKSDWDRMEDLKRKMDQEMDEFDRKTQKKDA
jgi:hypothetical protein